MSAIPSLWPDDIRADVRTPAAILNRQASALGPQTSGLLLAELTMSRGSGRVRYQLDIVAPSLTYRARILTAEHEKDLLYPVTVTAAIFRDTPPPKLGNQPPRTVTDSVAAARAQTQLHSAGPLPTTGTRLASTDEEFINLVRQVFTSITVRGLISSLLARSNSSPDVLDEAELLDAGSPPPPAG